MLVRTQICGLVSSFEKYANIKMRRYIRGTYTFKIKKYQIRTCVKWRIDVDLENK